MLHVAPEASVRGILERAGARTTTTDLAATGVDVRADLCELPLADGAYDGVVCLHVLEHVPDDRRALAELHRVLRPGGWACIDSPVMLERDETFEDPHLTDPRERERLFSQDDHVRVYGRSLWTRLGDAGFEVRLLAPDAGLGRLRALRLGLPRARGPLFTGLALSRRRP